MSFKTDKIQHLRHINGVYCFIYKNNVHYVGYSGNIYVRFLEHNYNNMNYDRFIPFDLIGYNKNEMKLVESIIINHFNPQINQTSIKNTTGFYMKYENDFEYEYDYYEDEANRIISNISGHLVKKDKRIEANFREKLYRMFG